MRRTVLRLLIALVFLPLRAWPQPTPNPSLLLDELKAQADRTPPVVDPTPAADSPAPAGLAEPAPAPPPPSRPVPSSAPAPRVFYDASVLRVPFGSTQPILNCAPLRACDIELQPGEIVKGYAVGDSERWLFERFSAGDPDAIHLVVKPTEWGIGTNLLIGTNRRTYNVSLVAPPKATTEKDAFHYTRLAFSYPADQLLDEERAATDRLLEARRSVATIPLASLHLDYRLAGDPRLSWMPLRVLDDAKRTYIQFRPGRPSEAPTLLAISPQGQAELLNYRATDDGLYYLVDGTYPHLRLLIRDGRKDAAIDIYRGAH